MERVRDFLKTTPGLVVLGVAVVAVFVVLFGPEATREMLAAVWAELTGGAE